MFHYLEIKFSCAANIKVEKRLLPFFGIYLGCNLCLRSEECLVPTLLHPTVYQIIALCYCVINPLALLSASHREWQSNAAPTSAKKCLRHFNLPSIKKSFDMINQTITFFMFTFMLMFIVLLLYKSYQICTTLKGA